MTPWYSEDATIVPAAMVAAGHTHRLSGSGMRNYLYFATAPGNQTLFVSQKKNGIVDRLPVV